MGIHAYELAADGSDWDEVAINEITAALGRVTDLGLYPVGPVSYTIFRVGSTYYRRDDLTGQITSNASFYTLINNTIVNDSANTGLTIRLKKGTFDLGVNTLTIGKNGINIIGETTWEGTAGGTTITYSGTGGAICIGDDSMYNYHSKLKDLNIVCSNTSATYGVRLYGTLYALLDTVKIHHSNSGNSATGLSIRGTTGNRFCVNNTIYNSRVYGFKYGIYMTTDGAQRVNNNRVLLGTMQGLGISGGKGIVMDATNIGDTNKFIAMDLSNFETHIDIGVGNYANFFMNVRMETGTNSVVNAGHDNVFLGGSISGGLATPSDTGYQNFYRFLYGVDIPDQITRTSSSVDLSGAATDIICFHAERKCRILKATLLYTEASSGDAGVTVRIGKELNDDYYYTGTSEVSKSKWYTLDVTLLQDDIDAGDTVTLGSPGSKTGTGEIMLVLEVQYNQADTS